MSCQTCQGLLTVEGDCNRCVNCGKGTYARAESLIHDAGPQTMDPRLLMDLGAIGEAMTKLGPDPADYDVGASAFALVAVTPHERERAILGLDPNALSPHRCALCHDDGGGTGDTLVPGRWYVPVTTGR